MERHRMAEHTRYERLYGLFLAYAALLALFGLIMDTPVNILRGLSTIILTEDALITDYVLIAGPGAALVNSALVTAISTLILRRSGEPFNGFSPVVVGLMSGFSLFGKNFVNIWPILLGTFLYAKSRREPVGKYAPVGLLATALAPVVSYIALDNGWGTPLAGGLVGILIGFIMPPLSAYTYKIQNGMNLYNVGFACGLAGSVLRGRPRDAEEVVSDAFLALWEHAGQVEPGKLRPWLGRVVRNKALNRLRALGGELPLEEDWLALEPDRRPGPAEAVEQAERAELIRALLNGLPPQDRAIFLRHYYYGQTAADIGAALAMPPSTVKVRLHRGRKKLKELLMERGYSCACADD